MTGSRMPTRPKAVATKKAAGRAEPMKSVRTALRLLMEFTREQPQFGVAELADKTGLSKSHVSKLLAAFAEAGLLDQDARTRTFSVALPAFLLGARFVNYDRLSSEAMPIMRELTGRTGHSTRLSVLHGDDAIYMFGIEGPLFVDTGWRAGTRLPLHSTTAGRILLAFLDTKRSDALIRNLRMTRYTPHTLTDRTVLKRLMGKIRAQGYDLQLGETTEGLGTLGVPVFGQVEGALAILSIAFPVHLFPMDGVQRFLPSLHQSARTLSMRMGGAVYPFGGSPAVHATEAATARA
jgi:DNA-binding IclR family transcriptional regulator